MEDSIVVQVLETEYSKKWRLFGQVSYQMGVSTSCIVFRDEAENRMIIVPRGLIKWYCGLQKCSKSSREPYCKPLCFLEIVPEAAHGPGAIEIIPNEEGLNVTRWISKRMFPSQTSRVRDAMASCFKRVWTSIKDFFRGLCCCLAFKPKGEEMATPSALEQIIIPQEARLRESTLSDASSLTRPSRSPRLRHASLEGLPGADDDLRRSPVTRSHSLRDQVKYRRRDSLKRLKQGVTRVMRSLRQDTSSSQDIETYKSFEDIDDCFFFEDDDKLFQGLSNAKPRRVLENKIRDSFWDHQSSEDEQIDAGVVSRSDRPMSDSVSLSWYETRQVDRQMEADQVVPVAYDTSDGTVIVVDSMDIYKVPKTSLDSTAKEEKQLDTLPTPRFKSEIRIVIDEASDVASDLCEEEETEPTIKQCRPVTPEDDEERHESEIKLELSSPETSESYDKCDDATLEELGSDSDDESVAVGVSRRYVENSKSLSNLRMSANVTKHIAKFDKSD